MSRALRQNCRVLPFLLIMAFFSISVYAQNESVSTGDPPVNCSFSPGMGRMHHEGPRHQKARDMMLSLKIWKLTEALEIDEKMAEKIYPRVRELEELRYQQLKDIQSANQELRMALEKGEKTENLETMVDRIKKLRLQQATAELNRINEIFELLTLEQQAKFLLVEADFHQNIRRFLHDRKGGFKESGNASDMPM